MSIRELRLSKHLTQNEAANIIGIQLRTYQNYESGISKRDTLKINLIKKTLSEYKRYSETKGILSIDEIKDIVSEVCKRHKVNFVYLFGSYAKGTPKESSDIDLLVDCKEKGFRFMGLMGDFHDSLHKNIDLVQTKDLSNNITFLNEILKTGVKIYG